MALMSYKCPNCGGAWSLIRIPRNSNVNTAFQSSQRRK